MKRTRIDKGRIAVMRDGKDGDRKSEGRGVVVVNEMIRKGKVREKY